MPSLQIRDMPEEVFEALAERARRHRRSMAQQATTDLARSREYDSRERRRSIVTALRSTPHSARRGALDLVRLVREERER
jgi:antitoxin FitA